MADPGALRQCKNVTVSVAMEKEIRARADNIDALRLLKRAIESGVEGRSYNKTVDAIRIMARVDPLEVARNSRSFRRFLRVLGCPAYRDQSKIAR